MKISILLLSKPYSKHFCVPSRRKCLFKNLPGYPSLCPHYCCVSAIGVDHRGGPCLKIRLCLIRQKIMKINRVGFFCKDVARAREVKQNTSFPYLVCFLFHPCIYLSLQTGRYQHQSPNSFLKDELEDFTSK